MFVNKVSNNYQNKNRSDISFQMREIFDIGASNKKRGTLKILVQNNAGKDLFEYSGFVHDDPKGFLSNDYFIRQVAKNTNVGKLLEKDIKGFEAQIAEDHLLPEEEQKIKDALAESRAKLAIWNGQSASEKKLTKFALLLPGTLKGRDASFLPNLRKPDNTRLEDVKLSKIISVIKKENIVPIAENFSIKDDFIPIKDLGATGIGVAQKVANHPILGKRFTKGFHMVAVQTGGGFGAVDVEVLKKGMVNIRTNEEGHDLYFDPRTGGETRLGAQGVSTGSVIENFMNKFNILKTESRDAIWATGNARIATDLQVSLSTTKDAPAIKALLETGAYKLVSKNSEATIVRVKPQYIENFKQAVKYSVECYAQTIARHAIRRIDQSANLYVISGPLAMGLNNTIKSDPALFGGAADMRSLVLHKIDELVGKDSSCTKLMKDAGFDVVCEKALSISNNTPGGSLLLAGKTETYARRGQWIQITKKILKAAAKV